MRRAVSSVNPNLPVFLTRTMRDLYDDSMERTSFARVMLAIAGAMAFGLGIIGVYGVLSYVIAQRTREIGIRLALRAEPRRVLGMFVRQGVILSTTRLRDLTAGCGNVRGRSPEYAWTFHTGRLPSNE
jgi:ABC-type antimicrobial peptide transport system permease subunit